jgi:hypothetical protein
MEKKPRMGEDPLSWIKDTTTPPDQRGIPGRTAMTDTPQTTGLEAILTRLEQGWQELAESLRRQAQSQRRVIEAERFVLLDAAGNPRGQLAVKEDGAAGLSLCDKDERHCAWLEVQEDGSAFLSLKDHYGRIFFQVRGNSRNESLHTALEETGPPPLATDEATQQAPEAARPPEEPEAQPPAGPEPVTPGELPGELPGEMAEPAEPEAGAAPVTGTHDRLLLTGEQEITQALGLSWQEVQRLKKEYRLPVIERHGGPPLLCVPLLRKWALDMWGAETGEK